MSSRLKHFVFLISIITGGAAFAGQSLSGTDGTVRATAVISSSQITLAQDITAKITYEPVDVVSDPALVISDENFSVETIDEGLGYVNVRIEPRSDGEFEVLLKFEYTDPEEEKAIFGIGQLDINVKVGLSEKELEALKSGDISEIVDPIARTQDVESVPYDPAIFIAAAAAVLILAGGFILAAKKKRRQVKQQKKYVVVHNIAYRLLDDLKFLNLPQKGSFKLFYSKLSNILRYYIEYRFSIQAPDMTTEEFLERIRYSDELGSVDKSGIEKFFQISDMVKFAKFEPSSEQAEEAMDLVRSFVSDTEDYLCVIEENVAAEFESILEGKDD